MSASPAPPHWPIDDRAAWEESVRAESRWMDAIVRSRDTEDLLRALMGWAEAFQLRRMLFDRLRAREASA